MNDCNIKRFSRDEIAEMSGKTDWDRLRAQEEEDIDEDDLSVDWSKAELVRPEPKEMISIRMDADVLAFFRRGGRGYQSRMNQVLRSYMHQMQARR